MSVGDGAFSWCTNLAGVTIGHSLTNLGDFTFADCSSLAGAYFEGNAPTAGPSAFAYDNTTVYYLPGATGWGLTFAGRPAVLWNPQIQSGTPTFGVRNNQFGFTITGTMNIPLAVEASTSLASPGWTVLQTCTLTNGSIYFGDPAWRNYPARFYRIRPPVM